MHNCKARFRIATCGRRFGKTYMAVNEVVKFANKNKYIISIWVAPTYRQSKIAFNIMTNNFQGGYARCIKTPMQIEWHNGSITKFLSTESKDNLRGESAHLMVIDEAAMIEDEVWTNILRPMLSDTNGKAIIISTPRGLNNWFHTLYERGQDVDNKDYKSFKFPTASNPYIPNSEIIEVKRSLPADVFKQEYLAEFLEDGGSVFRNISGCIKGGFEDPKNKHSYIAAWDIAKHSDFSCIIVMDRKTNHVVHFDRFNRIDYSLQIKRLEDIVRRYNNAHVILDSTGVGDPILEQVMALGFAVEGFQFTNASKQQVIEHLAVCLERKSISFPDIPVLISELASFRYELTRAGSTKYSAPSGLHDDTVIALALACWNLRHHKNPRIFLM